MKKKLIFLLCLFFTAIICNQQTFAQLGALDLIFDIGLGADNIVQTIALQPDGKVIIGGWFADYNGINNNFIARLNSDGSLDTGFNSGTGANSSVSACVLQPDGKVIIVGAFTIYNGTSRNHIARLNANGSLDIGFNPGIGANNTITNCVLQPDGKVIISGVFTTYNGTTINGIARLNINGSLDTGFNPGAGPSSLVKRCSLQSDGKVIIVGFFNSYNGIAVNRIARLNSDGSLDTGFNPGTGANNSVETCVLQPDGKVIICGLFTNYNGITRNQIARLNSDGSLDTNFDSGTGVNGSLLTLALQADGKVILGGAFTYYNGIPINRVARLNADGSLDTDFNQGTGANEYVYACALQPDGKVIIGGDFTTYNGTARNRIARLYGCTIDQPAIISGPAINGCPGTTLIYSIAPVSGADNYTWSLPSGWSGSSTSTSITTTPNGNGGVISVRANSSACGSSTPQTLTVLPFQAPLPSVCLVTVDTLSTHNIIYWEKPVTALIDSFFIYREISANTYQKIGAVPYEDLNEYHDYAADPNSTTYKYKVSALDTCGFESEKSGFHNTIHLLNLGSGNLLWTQYGIENTGNPVTYYRVYRDDFGTNNFQPINTNIPGGNTTYTDVNYAAYPNAKYLVDVTWDISCTPFRSIVTTTRSNRWQNNIPVGLENELENLILVYPNPASELITIEFPENLKVLNLKIYNVLGEVVYQDAGLGKSKKQINIEEAAKGMYTLNVETEFGSVMKKILVQ